MFNFIRNIPLHERRMTISTALTLMRIALVPFIVGAMLSNAWAWACALFIVAAVTDALDGALARWRNEQTFLGASLDPIADKILIISCFFTLAFVQVPLVGIPVWFAGLIVLKEAALIAGIMFMYWYKGTIEIRPTLLGKATTLLQICFIIWLFACHFCGWVPMKTYYVLLGVMLAVVIVSFVQYIGIGLQQIRR